MLLELEADFFPGSKYMYIYIHSYIQCIYIYIQCVYIFYIQYITVYIYTYTVYIYIYTYTVYIYIHYTTLHYITLHYITLHYITLHYTTLHCTALHCIALHTDIPYIYIYISKLHGSSEARRVAGAAAVSTTLQGESRGPGKVGMDQTCGKSSENHRKIIGKP